MVVRFATAAEFVTEYAENLSAGGLFLRNGHELEPLSKIQVQLDLPGYGTYEVTAKVAHVMDPETAARFNRDPGAGLQLVDVPDGFEEALMGYLARLGKRRDCLLLIQEQDCVELCTNAGYLVQQTDMSSVTEHVMSSTILALIVNKGAASMFRDAIAISPQKVPVIGCECPTDAEALLVELDRLLAAL
jgi:hypothetical protein